MPSVAGPVVRLSAETNTGKTPVLSGLAAGNAKSDFRQHLAVVKTTAGSADFQAGSDGSLATAEPADNDLKTAAPAAPASPAMLAAAATATATAAGAEAEAEAVPVPLSAAAQPGSAPSTKTGKPAKANTLAPPQKSRAAKLPDTAQSIAAAVANGWVVAG
jgi:hypothetical protein